MHFCISDTFLYHLLQISDFKVKCALNNTQTNCDTFLYRSCGIWEFIWKILHTGILLCIHYTILFFRV